MAMAVAEATEDSILADFECPICTNYMFPPIRNCVSGHSFCSQCFNRIARCSQCRGQKTFTRCFVLERICAKLTFPCKYQADGCTWGAKGALIKKHEIHCKYGTSRCPLSFVRNCGWTGRKTDLIVHAKEQHPSHIYFEHRKRLVASGFGRFYSRRHYSSLFAVYDELFWFTWDLNNETGCVRFAVYNITQPEKEKFRYCISFLKGDTNVEVISATSLCEYCNTDEGRFVTGYYLMANYNMVKDLCDDRGNLYYFVTITMNDAIKQFMYEIYIRQPGIVDAVNEQQIHNNKQIENETQRENESQIENANGAVVVEENNRGTQQSLEETINDQNMCVSWSMSSTVARNNLH
ncbi:hypothetical protein NQ314_016847 [Rhamnusium bicolor]|uniref:RING-type E3 ubiquitin transferase n=1 Tax=Rhamnusium bicolor TaxID=1586634 RepID=A0AAV8WW57_9CUCU|nr:hypothetical protein NQ314_016847 [Rhamnusium bicolor]